VGQEDKKTGGVVLLKQEHEGQENPWKKPVVGWRPTAGTGVGSLYNPMGFACLRVVNV